MEEEQSLFTTMMVFGLALVALTAAWVVAGPGSNWLALLYADVATVVHSGANWYQQKLEGSAKLVAPVITIASGSYAIVKGYKYAEARLHYRLSDFLEREEVRLRGARQQLRLIVERPGVERNFRQPIFLSPGLRRAVRELGWGSYLLPPQIEYASYQLNSAIDELEKQVSLSTQRHKSLDAQLATAHLLKGAMWAAEAAKAKKAGKDDRVALTNALNHFRSALEIDPNDHEALEYASHIHVCLKQDRDAEPLLDKLLSATSHESKSLTRARAFRYKSNIAALRSRNGVAVKNLRKALTVLPNLCGADRVEEAEIHESLADCQEAMGNHIQARSHWDIAAALYREIHFAAGIERVRVKLEELDRSPDGDRDAGDTLDASDSSEQNLVATSLPA